VSVANYFGFLALVQTGVLGTSATLDAKLQQALAEMAFSVTASSQAEFAQLLQQDLRKWGPVVQRTGFKAEG
jgi:tripartite-type tricarboxylate transporter receptor subunit TctC